MPLPHPVTRAAVGFFLPGGLLFALAIAALHHGATRQWLATVAPPYLYLVLAAALLLGWRFDRSRLVFGAVVFGLAAWLLQQYGLGRGATSRLVFDTVAVLLPANIALLALARERGIFTWHGLLRWALILAQPLLVGYLLSQQRHDLLATLQRPLLPLAALDGLRLAQPALLAFAVALLATGLLGFSQRNATENGLFWALALAAYALLGKQPPALTVALFASAILILSIAVIELSHFMAFRDELTGLPGRRALNHALLKLGSRYTVAMVDVDHFKKFNDTYGHDVGDEVLKMVATRLGTVRGGGRAYRYGGEEFTVLFPGKAADDALPHLEQLRAAIADSGFTVRGKQRPRKKGSRPAKPGTKQVTITVSIGVAERSGEQRDPDEVIKAADKALYRAKKGGRNQVAV